MKSLIIHILDSQIVAKYHQKIDLLNPSIKNGRIAEEKEFLKNMKHYIQEHKINQKLFGEALTVIVSDTYTPQDILYLKDIFQELEFNPVNIVIESSLIAEMHPTIIIDELTTRIFFQGFSQISTSLFLKIPEAIISSLNSPASNIAVADIFNQLVDKEKKSLTYYSNPAEVLLTKIE